MVAAEAISLMSVTPSPDPPGVVMYGGDRRVGPGAFGLGREPEYEHARHETPEPDHERDGPGAGEAPRGQAVSFPDGQGGS